LTLLIKRAERDLKGGVRLRGGHRLNPKEKRLMKRRFHEPGLAFRGGREGGAGRERLKKQPRLDGISKKEREDAEKKYPKTQTTRNRFRWCRER